MTRAVILALGLTVMGLSAAAAADGLKVFRKNCTGCHSVKSERVRAQIPPGSELGGVGTRLDADALRAVIDGRNETGEKHKPFKGSKEELQALIDWLMAVK